MNLKISFIKKVNLMLLCWGCIPKVPLRTKINILLKPLDSTRYTEISYIINFIKDNLLSFPLSLDISSPFILSYILSKKGKVIKTDISPEEKKFIKESRNLKFEIQNALALTYPKNTFNFVFAVSSIEHIYEGFLQSINEMIRVVKPNGYIYLSFPVSNNFNEEWLNQNIYSNQFIKNGKVFFQYRFDKKKLESILSNLEEVSLYKKDIYWEKYNGSYNKMILKLKKSTGINSIDFLKNAIVNLYYGFTLLNIYPEDFGNAKDLGIISIILKKKNDD